MNISRRSISVVIISVLLLSSWLARPAAAEDAPLSDSHKARIIASCLSAQNTLSQLHASDGLLRVNRKSLYDTISMKLMSPLNERITVNRFNGDKLIATTSDYDKSLTAFRTNYISYEVAMSALLKVDCQKDPTTFYYSVADVRSKRAKVYDEVKTIKKLVGTYKSNFDEFRQEYKTAAEQVSRP